MRFSDADTRRFPNGTRRVGSLRRRAVAAVEMAFVAPILFTLVLCAVEFGRAMMVANVLTMSAREGARAGSLPGSSNTDVTTAVNNELTAALLPVAKATTTIKVNSTEANVSTAVMGNRITVVVTIPAGAVTWLPSSFFLSSTAELQGQAVMRRE